MQCSYHVNEREVHVPTSASIAERTYSIVSAVSLELPGLAFFAGGLLPRRCPLDARASCLTAAVAATGVSEAAELFPRRYSLDSCLTVVGTAAAASSSTPPSRRPLAMKASDMAAVAEAMASGEPCPNRCPLDAVGVWRLPVAVGETVLGVPLPNW